VAAAVLSILKGYLPVPDELSRITNQVLAVAFLGAAFVSLFFTIFYKPVPTPQAVEAARTNDAAIFWAEVKRRHRLFFVIWVGWLVVGFPLWGLFALIFRADNPMVPGVAALLTWGAVWYWSMWHLTSMRCFHCGKRAFDHALFFLRHARCSNCGTPYTAT